MSQFLVGIEKYKENDGTVKKVIESAGLFENLKSTDSVFLKPNIVVWTDKSVFPKWGVITTSRVIEELVIALKEYGVQKITIGEGIILLDPKNSGVADHAYKNLGYETLNKRYGVEFVNVMDRPFEKVEAGSMNLHVNSDILHSDFVFNLPVMKTHAQTVVSLGMKNLKGVLNIASRKKCHSTNPEAPLDYMISQLPKILPPTATIIDGIYSLERGPAPDGKAHRTNLIIGSRDTLSADMAGASVLGYEPANVPSIVFAADQEKRPIDMSDIEIKGEPIKEVTSFHEYDFPYNEDNSLHSKMEKMNIKGLTYWKYDNTMCTYCSIINGAVLTSIFFAWKGEPWDDVEILTGKQMEPSPGMNKTILLGQCMYNLNKNHPNIKEIIAVKGCPPSPEDTVAALHKAGIPVEAGIFQNLEAGLGFFMAKYKDKPEFDDSFFRVE